MRKITFIFTGIFLFLTIFSCEYQENIIDQSSIDPEIIIDKNSAVKLSQTTLSKKQIEKICCGKKKVYYIFAGKDIKIGKLSVVNSRDKLYVRYEVYGNWWLDETHLFVGKKDDIPLTNSANPKIGHFPYHGSHNLVQTYTFTIPMDNLDDCFVIVAHAAVIEKQNDEIISSETAFSCGNHEFEGDRWGWYFDYCKQSCGDEKDNDGDDDSSDDDGSDDDSSDDDGTDDDGTDDNGTDDDGTDDDGTDDDSSDDDSSDDDSSDDDSSDDDGTDDDSSDDDGTDDDGTDDDSSDDDGTDDDGTDDDGTDDGNNDDNDDNSSTNGGLDGTNGNDDVSDDTDSSGNETTYECLDAFGYKSLNSDQSFCFIDDGFSQWGWTNAFMYSQTINYQDNYTYSIPLYANADECNLSNGIQVGYVRIYNIIGQEVVLTANIDYVITDDNYKLSEINLYIGSQKYPLDAFGNKTVLPSEYTYSEFNLNTTSFTFEGVTWPIDTYIIPYAYVCPAGL